MTIKRFFAFLLAGALALSLCACSGGGSVGATGGVLALMNTVTYPEVIDFSDYEALRENRDKNGVDDAFLAALDAFAMESGSAALSLDDGNANFSPVSLYYALALAARGAKGATKDELLALLGAPSADDLGENCAKLYRLLYTDNGVGKLKIANSLWLDSEVQGSEVKFKEDYLSSAADEFFASVYKADFEDAATGEAMSKWISDNTGGTLAPSFDTDPYQLMSIINTVYLYDEWANQFDEGSTAPAAFHAPGGDVEAEFMHSASSGSVFVGEGYMRATLGLKSLGNFTFILPDEGVSVSDLVSSPEALSELFHGGTEEFCQIDWSVPKFAYNTKFDLADTLKTLGIPAAFDETAADFSLITDTDAWISSVVQETRISIDENGVEASAYTELALCGTGVSMGRADMKLERPFIYGITAHNGALLFVGVCCNPVA